MSSELDVYYSFSDGERYPHKWGYTDTQFEFTESGAVRVTGDRYPLAGYEMPEFLPFVREVLGVSVTPEDSNVEVEQDVTDPNLNEAFVQQIREALQEDQISLDAKERLIHSHGQLSVGEIYRVLYDKSFDRFVDLVVYPMSENDVQRIIEAADEHDVCLIPYGGGTNVSGALIVPKNERHMVVSVDMRRMNRILWIDTENNMACIEAGIYGKHLERELNAQGLTTGHDPDSIELSTLGGWIATNASGMKKNRYGNIEDIVIEATLITPAGVVDMKSVTPRNSIGIHTKQLMFGSEGNLGIITKAVLKIHPQPEIREYGSLVFPTFEKGVAFLRELRSTGVIPASIRLVNNFEFRFGQALKGESKGFKAVKSRLEKIALLKVAGFDPKKMVACTVVMEGSRNEVAQQRRIVFSTAKKHSGISGGAANGKRGYMLTFGIAYIRDFLNQFGILGETFETSVPWNRIHQVVKAVEEKLYEQHAHYKITGKPYLSYRVTQTYHTGVCIYFTMGMCGRDIENAIDIYHDVEHSLRQTVVDNGGSLSHHHGVGKIRQGFLPQAQTEGAFTILRGAKHAVDPKNVFGARNSQLGDPEDVEGQA